MTAWRALLTGAERARALAAVQAVTEALSVPTETTWPYAHEVALLHTYADPNGDTRAAAFINAATDYVATHPLLPSLFRGVCGVGWIIAHVDPGGGESLHAVDELVEEVLVRAQPPFAFDLVEGMVGIGVYALARLPSERARAMLASIVRSLDKIAHWERDGCAWLTPPELLSASRRCESPDGHYDLGVAHGIAGIIAFLARARRAGIDVGRTSRLLDGAQSWLDQQRSSRWNSVFPAWARPDGRATPARSAWCYGDPGIALALYSAATDDGARRRALDIALTAAARPAEQCDVVDGGVCHGAVGLGHIYNRLYHASGDPRLGEAATRWFGRCLSFRRESGGIGGFRALWPTADGKGRWVDDGSLLTGATGIALGLLAACTDVEPRWDGFFLLDVPDA